VDFDPGIAIEATAEPLGFRYGATCFGPVPELRTLDSIRPSLRDPACAGPAVVYAIAMDAGESADRADLQRRHLLLGVVTYSAGLLGHEPVRSQGHVHAPSPRNGWSTPEVYEIWDGDACVLMQEHDTDDPGRCYAVYGSAGDVLVVPPGWAHATINANPARNMTFAAWCDREYGFSYDGVRSHGGLAWFPLVAAQGLRWEANPRYRRRRLIEKAPAARSDLGLEPDVAIYRQYAADRGRFGFVPDPAQASGVWQRYVP
jgi:glucose-6-phosphate isomerase, archaeal